DSSLLLERTKSPIDSIGSRCTHESGFCTIPCPKLVEFVGWFSRRFQALRQIAQQVLKTARFNGQIFFGCLFFPLSTGETSRQHPGSLPCSICLRFSRLCVNSSSTPGSCVTFGEATSWPEGFSIWPTGPSRRAASSTASPRGGNRRNLSIA